MPVDRVRLWPRFLLGALAVLVLSAGATATAGLLHVDTLAKLLGKGGSIKNPGTKIPRPGEPQTILVIGSDHRFRDGKAPARSDTILLVRINAKSSTINVMSVPRDLKVQIPRPNGLYTTDKINAAFSIGGPALTVKVLKRLLPGLQINHVVSTTFGGFTHLVDAIGCVYTDVDRRYFNDNAPPAGGGGPYAAINVEAGYEKLCDQNALDYVRFRHLDTDIVRSARQQDFLRAAKSNYSSSQIVANHDRLVGIFGRYTQSDHNLHTTDGLLNLFDLVAFSAGHSLREVHFPAILPSRPNDPYVTATPGALRHAMYEFMAVIPSGGNGGGGGTGGGKGAPKRPARAPTAGLVNAAQQGQQQGILLGPSVRMPVYYPKLLTASGHYVAPLAGHYPRNYLIRDPQGKVHHAYRLVIYNGQLGQYYGVQGLAWSNPPILNHISETRQVGGKTLELVFDGHKLRLVAWHHGGSVYWISNTLSEDLNNQQMLGIAASLTRLGGGR
jgi:LCP family protein required for cell wall assembly